MEVPPDTLGFTTAEALHRLRVDIAQLLREHLLTDTSKLHYLRDIISLSSEKVLLSGVAYMVVFLYTICMVITYVVGESVQADAILLLQAAFLGFALMGNFALAVHEDNLRRKEIPHRVKHAVATLEAAARQCEWDETHYPHLCAPFSPCVTLQWTYRDARIVNLPWALLVQGDVVVVRPGQELPGRCTPLNANAGKRDTPTATKGKQKTREPTTRAPHPNEAYVMQETPYLSNLRLALEQARDRPATVYDKQRYLCTVRLMCGVIFPLTLCVVIVASVLRHVAALPGPEPWTEIYFLQPVAATLPLLQIVFPAVWVALNCYGLAKFKVLSESRQEYNRAKSGSISEDVHDPLLEVFSDTNMSGDRHLAATFVGILRGKEDMITRTSNIVHVLGSLSALCCVDKKGILSWPNPTAEKVFFLRNASPVSRASSGSSLVYSADHHQTVEEREEKHKHHSEPTTVAEVLDLTHDQNAPFSLEFDSKSWREHVSLLKPLGLAALLNTCAPQPRHAYSHLCAHLTCEAQLSDDVVPVTNRRCLCELAKQIGFQEGAVDMYGVEESLAVFRHLQPDTIRRETRFARSLHLSTKVKVPLPHMLATIVTDPFKRLQLLSQGTADIVVDSCVDYWNGCDLTPLTPSDRKKVLDFYQRSSLTAYCTAFAYKPLNRGIDHKLASTYLELPADSRQLYPTQLDQWSEHTTPISTHFHSSDSLLFNNTREDDVTDAQGFYDLQSNQVFVGMVTQQYQAQSDMVELVERLERACIRFVHFSKENELRSRVFSEKMGLESGWNCHISLMSDPPVRPGSPVSQSLPASNERKLQSDRKKSSYLAFTTRDGASLLYSNMESTKPLSKSAPGAINLDHTIVKFDSEIKRTRHSIPANNDTKMAHGFAESSLPSADSLLEESRTRTGNMAAGDGDSPLEACRSLSCLTDSTDHSAPLNFDMSNRAKLPRGIDNIRPHIEQVDNVPLLVSLFTDCTAASTRRMIAIMQDYGETVCVIGSAANRDNMHVFMQADASIALEPLYPVLCQKLPPYLTPQHCVGPIDLARSLNAICCSISSARDSDISLFSLITLSRHYMTSLWNAVQFWMCAVSSISLLQTLSVVGLLPLCLSLGGVAWSSMAVVPALSAALVCAPLAPAVMHSAAVHTRHPDINAQVIVFVFWCYGLKFIPAVFSILALYGITLRSFCEQIASAAAGALYCGSVYPHNTGNASHALDLATRSHNGWGDDFYDGYYLAQHIALSLLTLHLIVISISFVDRNASLWQKGFWHNRVWCISVLVILAVQATYSGAMLWRQYGACERWNMCSLRYRVPWTLWLGYGLSPLLTLALNEFIKWQEIKANQRFQRRARLDFGTKLGMNSPF